RRAERDRRPAAPGGCGLIMTAWGLRLVREWDADLRGGDPLDFPGYSRTLKEAEAESVTTGLAELDGCEVALIQTRFDRFGGTMGAVAGEKVVRAFGRAAAGSLPVVAVTATGGARLQEGMIALVQMARTVAARARHAAAGQLMVAVYDSPTTGGVYASWASLADIRAATAGATIGFGGPRVVEQVTGQWPLLTSHTAEAAYDAGLVDRVLPPGTETDWLRVVLGRREQPLTLGPRRPEAGGYPGAGDISGGWATVQAARSTTRPSGLEWAAALTTSWTDLHGPAPVIRAGLARIGGRQAIVVAMDRHAYMDGNARP